MSPSDSQDPAWQDAWSWIRREHDDGQLSVDDRARLQVWLASSPANRAAYEEAARLWLLAGMVPPSAKREDT